MDCNITYRQKDKGWQFIISYKVNGKWKQKSKQGYKTKKEAKPAAEKLLSSLKKQIENEENVLNADYNVVTLKEVRDLYLKHIKIYKEPGTVHVARVATNAFNDLFDKVVPSITKADIQSIINDHVTSKDLKQTTLTGYVVYLNQVLNYYKENYDNSYEPPTQKLTFPKKTQAIKKALTKTELDELLLYFKKNRPEHEYIICLIAGTCGLRFGEIMGLTWSDIDETNSELNITKQWKKDKEGEWGFGSLKTTNSKRKVPIPPTTLKALKNYHKNSITDINNRIIALNFGSTRVILHTALSNAAGISIHELRHTYTTLLIGKIDFKTIAEYIGDDVQQVYKTYSHVNDDMRKTAAKMIAEIF